MRGLKDYLVSSKREITLRSGDVASVLRRYVGGRVNIDQLARWGSFVFHSYPTWSKSERKHPLPIRNDPAHEELLSEILLELEQIGAQIDGDFAPRKAVALLHQLTTTRGIPQPRRG